MTKSLALIDDLYLLFPQNNIPCFHWFFSRESTHYLLGEKREGLAWSDSINSSNINSSFNTFQSQVSAKSLCGVLQAVSSGLDGCVLSFGLAKTGKNHVSYVFHHCCFLSSTSSLQNHLQWCIIDLLSPSAYFISVYKQLHL